MELCLLNLLILIDCFLCNSCPRVLFESLSHVINQESHVSSWNLGKIYLIHFLKCWNLPRFTQKISKFQKSALGKFIPNFPLKYMITSTNTFNQGFPISKNNKNHLTLSWRRPISYRNQSIDLRSKFGFYMISASVMKELSVLCMLRYLCKDGQRTAYMKHFDTISV